MDLREDDSLHARQSSDRLVRPYTGLIAANGKSFPLPTIPPSSKSCVMRSVMVLILGVLLGSFEAGFGYVMYKEQRQLDTWSLNVNGSTG
jgi:hypothetical protein